MSRAFDLVKARSGLEEGVVLYAYNDRTSRRVTCITQDPATTGNLSIGRGINLEVGLDAAEEEWLFEHRLAKTEQLLLRYSWYASSSDEPVRQSVVLDAAYNLGIRGLIYGFPNFVNAFATRDWARAEAELTVKEENVDKQRYEPLRALIRAGGQ